MLTGYEQQYMYNLQMILTKGKREMNARTGIETLRLPFTEIAVDLSKEFPILKSKKVLWQTAVKELLWMMQKQSNNTKELGSKIWDAWADENGSIGETYGAQIKKFKQVDYVLETLRNDPSSRRALLDMWNFADLDKMALYPCVYSSIWNIIDGKLNCVVIQRSADYPVGVPFDTLQYAVLTHLFAAHLGVDPGMLFHTMADSHIYANQIPGVEKQLEQYHQLFDKTNDEKLSTIIAAVPKLYINKDVRNFYDFKLEDIQVLDYVHHNRIKFDVAT